MKTQNVKLLEPNANRDYYQVSDGNFMPVNVSNMAHTQIDRIRWAREKIHELGSMEHLDVGGKDGYLTLTLMSEGINCIAIDPSTDAIENAKQKAFELGLEENFEVAFIEDYETPFYFDTVSCLEVIEHVVDPDVVMKKLASLGEYVLVSTPDALGEHGLEDSKRNEEHVRIYNRAEFETLCSKHGEIIESDVRDNQIVIMFKSNEN